MTVGRWTARRFAGWPGSAGTPLRDLSPRRCRWRPLADATAVGAVVAALLAPLTGGAGLIVAGVLVATAPRRAAGTA